MKWASRPEVTGLNQCAEICSQPIWYFSNGCLKCRTQLCYKSQAEIILKESSVIWKLKSMKTHNKNNTHLDIYVKQKIICVIDIRNSYFLQVFFLCVPFLAETNFNVHKKSTLGRSPHVWYLLKNVRRTKFRIARTWIRKPSTC